MDAIDGQEVAEGPVPFRLPVSDFRLLSTARTAALLLMLLMGGSALLNAQPGQSLLEELADEEKDAVNALVMYPEDTRMAILESSQYPEALIKMQRLQTQTSESFQNLLAGYPQSTQEMIWDITRYPGLVERLVVEGRGSRSSIQMVLKDYPEAVSDNALSAGMQYLPLLEEIHRIFGEAGGRDVHRRYRGERTGVAGLDGVGPGEFGLLVIFVHDRAAQPHAVTRLDARRALGVDVDAVTGGGVAVTLRVLEIEAVRVDAGDDADGIDPLLIER